MRPTWETKDRLGRVEYGVPLAVEETKTVGDGWEVSGYCSTFGNEDKVGDIVAPGAFTKTLAADPKTLFLYCHDLKQMLGVPLTLREDAKGLFGRFKISKTQLGETIHTLMEDGAPFGFSIGFLPHEFDYNDAGNRVLKQIGLIENTLAPLPIIANPEAQVTAFKTLLGLPEMETHAVWSTAYVNNLEDSCFAGVEPGGTKDSDGLTTPRSLRHLPHHAKGNGGDGPVDLIHLRNALSRVEQMKDGGPAFQARCRAHLERHARALGVGDSSSSSGGGKTMNGENDGDESAMNCMNDAHGAMQQADTHHKTAMSALEQGMQMMRSGKALDSFDPAEMPFDEAWRIITNLLTLGVEHTKSLRARRSADGREFGPRHTEALRSVLESLEGAQIEMKTLLAAPIPAVEAETTVPENQPGDGTDLQQRMADLRRKLDRHPRLVL